MMVRAWAAALTVCCALAWTPARAQGDAHAAEDAEAQGPKVAWTHGPATVDVGSDLAKLDVPEGFSIAGPADTRAILERMGNRTDGSELALLVPRAEGQDWFVVFEWQPVGYVKDDEKDDIDAAAILKNIQEATEEGNAWRRENNIPELHVTGWAEPPRYDETTHNLVWATLAESADGSKSSNYNMRLLGRRGFMSVTLVESAEGLAAAKPEAHRAIAGFAFKQGGSYAEFKSGDKVAEYGLTALVAAGAGAAAVKLGLFGVLAKLFAKAGKAIVAGIVALGAMLAKAWQAIRGRKEPEVQTDLPPQP